MGFFGPEKKSPIEKPKDEVEVKKELDGHEKEKAKDGAEAKVLPKLNLKELVRSEKPINKPESEAEEKEVENIKSWNNYTIVTLKDWSKIIILDENAQIIPGFTEPENLKRVVFYWSDQRIRKKVGKAYIGLKTNAETAGISEIPIELRGFARAQLANSHSEFFQLANTREMGYSFSKDIIVTDDYVIFIGKEGGCLAYATRDESGVILAPKDWRRINYLEPASQKLQGYIEKILEEYGGYKWINDKYSARVTEVGINIVKKEEVKGTPLFVDNVPHIEENVVADPTNSNVIYYCQSSNPKSVSRLDLSGEPDTWKATSAELSQRYDSVNNLQLDPSGNFFLFYSKDDLVVIAKDSLEEVKRVPGLTNVNFDALGNIRAVDKDGHLVIYEVNFNKLAQEIDKQRVAKLAQGIKIVDIFELEVSKKALAQKGGAGLEYLEPLRTQYEQQFTEVLAKITTPEGAQQLRRGFDKLAEVLKQQGLKPSEVAFIISGLEGPIEEKEKEFAIKATQEALVSVRAKLASGLSISSVSEARAEMEKIRGTEALLEADLRQEVHEVTLELEQRSLELFRQRGGEITKDIHGLLERTKTDLEGFTSKSQMDDWLEFRYPQLKSRLGSLAKDVPLEADEAYKAIVAARTELQELATQFEDKFKREYAKVREKATERIGATVDILAQDVDGLIERLRTKGFTSRTAAEQYLSSSEAKKTLETEIAGLAGDNPDVAKELERGLKVRLSNTLTEIERGALTQIAKTGQQMVMFGETAFLKWEAKVKEKMERKVYLTFEEDAKTHGPGVKAGDVFGDVAINIRISAGKTENVRLYEGWQDENDWRLGLLTYRGESIPPSYVTATEYKTIRKDYANWSQGEKSNLRKELQEKRNVLKEVYLKRQKIKERPFETDSTGKKKYTDEKWQKEYKQKLQEYATFAAEHHIPLLRRIDQIRAEPEIEYTNGKGFVPEWQSHWVVDRQTSKYLEDMAKRFEMQLKLQEGILNLKGHAGTGKDVLLKMFCAKEGGTNRPYFPIDCSKWTTEFELSQDVSLGEKEGISVTVRDDSAVLSGIQTPGAVVYFNEFNAMPEQAQMFLHALMDEKRSLTLKTSSGRVVKAHSTVLLACSMNPGYRGTTEPQSATRRRMVSLEIDYPPLTRKPDAGDTNPNSPYDASEALRIARGIDSFSDLTYESNLERNEFVKMWDKYINGIENDSPEPTVTQKFDLDTILALVQFANILRENFIQYSKKGRDSKNALPVIHPISGSELRRCAYWLNKMMPEKKVTANPEVVARNLINEWFLSNIDIKEDQDKIRTAMSTWTSKKRVRA